MPALNKKQSHDGHLKPHEVVDMKVETLQQRNARVEAEKAWETSWTRRSFIMIATYIVAGFYMQLINTPSPWLGALVPTLGYLLSNFSLPFIRHWWLEKRYKNTRPDAPSTE